jgi:hypothetical protein
MGVRAVAIWGGYRKPVGMTIWLCFAIANVVTYYCFITSTIDLYRKFCSIFLSPMVQVISLQISFIVYREENLLMLWLDHVYFDTAGRICLVDNARQLVWGSPASQIAFDTLVTILIIYKGWNHRGIINSSNPSVVSAFIPRLCDVISLFVSLAHPFDSSVIWFWCDVKKFLLNNHFFSSGLLFSGVSCKFSCS